MTETAPVKSHPGPTSSRRCVRGLSAEAAEEPGSTVLGRLATIEPPDPRSVPAHEFFSQLTADEA